MSDATMSDFDFEESYEAQTVSAQPKRQLIIRSTIIDSKNIKRERIVLTPSMCTKQGCRFDAAARYGGWDYAPDRERAVLADVLIQHVNTFHNLSEDLIVDEDQLPSQWLGEDAKRKPLMSPVVENSKDNAANPRVVLK